MKIFSFDVETDGLYGDFFAVGAVVLQDGEEIARFDGIAEQDDVSNAWVRENVLPNLSGLKKFASRREMRDAFWDFWLAHKGDALCIADFGSPVESGFFRSVIQDDLEERQWEGPYPLHEVGTMLLAKGIDPDVNRIEFSGLSDLRQHNPVDDAIASAVSWQLAQEGEAWLKGEQ